MFLYALAVVVPAPGHPYTVSARCWLGSLLASAERPASTRSDWCLAPPGACRSPFVVVCLTYK
ncbi:hypothetical protein HBB16_03860 [Pseudonocardia sp. MCCB 268]|nr:hypothetical protein [Pseudonocardia cytotoxica]